MYIGYRSRTDYTPKYVNLLEFYFLNKLYVIHSLNKVNEIYMNNGKVIFSSMFACFISGTVERISIVALRIHNKGC
jgi:hypothetical protein